jgi:hypothetical protein
LLFLSEPTITSNLEHGFQTRFFMCTGVLVSLKRVFG